MEPTSSRIHAFDWLRGLAVPVMIQTHCVMLLRPELQTTEAARWLMRIDGLVAPSFLFSAGFALALVQVRAGLGGRRREQAITSLRRIGEVLAVASLINLIWFPLSEPKWLLRMDILQCIALSLAAVLPVLVGLATRPVLLRWVLLGGSLVIFALAPLGERVTGWPSALLNTSPVLDDTTGAPFPLLPWAGYVVLGASFGATIAARRSERTVWAWIGLLAVLGEVGWLLRGPLEQAYPPHHFWVTNPAESAHRWLQVVGVLAVLRGIELRWPSSTGSRFGRWLAGLGASSLGAYFFHEMLLFERHVGVFARFWKGQADWPLFWVLVVAAIAATWLCVQLFARLSAWAARPRRAS